MIPVRSSRIASINSKEKHQYKRERKVSGRILLMESGRLWKEYVPLYPSAAAHKLSAAPRTGAAARYVRCCPLSPPAPAPAPVVSGQDLLHTQ